MLTKPFAGVSGSKPTVVVDTAGVVVNESLVVLICSVVEITACGVVVSPEFLWNTRKLLKTRIISVPLGDTNDVSMCWDGRFPTDPSGFCVLFLLLFLIRLPFSIDETADNGFSVVFPACNEFLLVSSVKVPVIGKTGINVVGNLKNGNPVLGRVGIVVPCVIWASSGFRVPRITNSWFLTKFKFLGKFPWRNCIRRRNLSLCWLDQKGSFRRAGFSGWPILPDTGTEEWALLTLLGSFEDKSTIKKVNA